MSVPGIVQSTLNGEEIAARVSLGSDDELFVTPSSTLVYRSDGLLSDESVDEYPHDADRLTLSDGRRKTKFTLEYPLEGTETFTVPSSTTDAVLHPVLAGLLNGNGITDPGETVAQTYRFSELTLIITSDRLVKHIGAAVWDGDYEEYHYDDVTDLAFEDGSVATQIVLTANGRPQRIKAPNEQANDLRERLKRALFEYHDVASLEELNETVGVDEPVGEPDHGTVDFGDGVDPLDANPPEPDDAAGDGPDGATEAATASADSLENEPATARSETHATDQPQAQQAGSDQEAASTTAQQTTAEPNTERTAASEADTTFEMGTETAAAESASDLETGDTPASGGSQDNQDASHDVTPESGDRDVLGESPSLLGTDSESDADAASTADSSQDTEASRETDPKLLERIESLEATVERQTELLERQQQTIEQLIIELRERR